VIPALVLSIVVAVLAVLYLWVRPRRSSQDRSPEQPKPSKFDTTLGEFRWRDCCLDG